MLLIENASHMMALALTAQRSWMAALTSKISFDIQVRLAPDFHGFPCRSTQTLCSTQLRRSQFPFWTPWVKECAQLCSQVVWRWGELRQRIVCGNECQEKSIVFLWPSHDLTWNWSLAKWNFYLYLEILVGKHLQIRV